MRVDIQKAARRTKKKTAKEKTKLIAITDKQRDTIRRLHDKGWSSAKIAKRFKSRLTTHQIGAIRAWMRRGKY